MKPIQVVAGVIYQDYTTLGHSDNALILIARRPGHLHQGGLWEFPGGKVEPNEHHYDSLVRELKEELNITVTSASPLMEISHDYSDKSVTLDIWKVINFDGYAEGVEGQEIRWVPLSELCDYNFPTANEAILERLISDQSHLA
jgi:8-oxo-dGTP diphosphatase